jgi:hypothetical protein
MKNRQKKRRVVELNEPMLEYEKTGIESDDTAH